MRIIPATQALGATWSEAVQVHGLVGLLDQTTDKSIKSDIHNWQTIFSLASTMTVWHFMQQ